MSSRPGNLRRPDGEDANLMVDGWCTGCHKPLGKKVAWDAADFTWHRKCWKAREVYTPPPRRVRSVA